MSSLGTPEGRSYARPLFSGGSGFRRNVPMQYLLLSLLAVAALFAQQGKQTFTGIITDDECPMANHSRMHMGATDAECAKACVRAHSGSYVVYDGKDNYTLSDQEKAEDFAAQKVTVVGALDAKTKTIQVDSITAVR